MDSVLELWR